MVIFYKVKWLKEIRAMGHGRGLPRIRAKAYFSQSTQSTRRRACLVSCADKIKYLPEA